VKFIFATTEIRKVPITVLSRCQRFDLRRISASDLVGLFSTIAEKEGISADPDALAMIARAAEGSARDGLSLLDQAIAHGSGHVEPDAVRSMLGLADRARIVDLFQHIAKGDVAAALSEFAAQYDAGASPSVVLTDLADFTHLVTRLKFVPNAANDPSLSEVERVRGADFAGTVAVTTLSRLWQMLLKGIAETETASRPAGAAEMVIIRLTHAASLPSPEDAARRLADFSMTDGQRPAPAPVGTGNGPAPGGTSASATGQSFTPRPSGGGATAQLRAVPSTPAPDLAVGRTEAKPNVQQKPAPNVAISSVQDIVDLCSKNRDAKLKALVRSYVRLVRLEPGRLEISLPDEAPKTLVAELQRRLEEWTSDRWMVILSREPGHLSLADAEAKLRDERVTDARSDPDVAAILARFPGAKITNVKVMSQEEDDTVPAPAPAAAESSDGDILPGDDIEF
ncbi:MAG: polymerase subunit gamma and tau, partial [Pseudomonadota bacterium]